MGSRESVFRLKMKELDNLRSDEMRMKLETRPEDQQQLTPLIIEQLRERELELAVTKAESETPAARLTIAEADLESARGRLADGARGVDEHFSAALVVDPFTRKSVAAADGQAASAWPARWTILSSQ